ncbi:MAG: 50S ribosomal protein L11 methyltransferase [Proteobacteria bacterium]|nr:50S ribosomal protein L11 methyltransferase [Pseudomonadota bacterium]MBI3497734.1 50S ribosomal protein L11 methyltransferase [Pseudomonadota bacterium]
MTGPRGSVIAGWRIEFEVPERALAVFAAALDGLAEAVATVEVAGSCAWRVEAFANQAPDPAGLALALELAAAASGLPVPAPSIHAVPAIDWVAANYREFPPVQAGRYFIHGSHWRGSSPPGSIQLRIDAATAFGSGEHATTRGCLLALDRLQRRLRLRHVLDLGCGTGILGLAAARTWHCPTLGVDIDPVAVKVAGANARANGLARWVRMAVSRGFANPAIRRRGPYDLILANVLARPLMRLARPLARRLAPGGHAVLSGLLASQERQVLAAQRMQGLTLQTRIAIDGWHTLVVRRAPRRLRAD